MTRFTADYFRTALAAWETFSASLGHAPDRRDEGVFIDWLRDHMDLSDHWTAYLRFHRVPHGIRQAMRWREGEERRAAERGASYVPA